MSPYREGVEAYRTYGETAYYMAVELADDVDEFHRGCQDAERLAKLVSQTEMIPSHEL